MKDIKVEFAGQEGIEAGVIKLDVVKLLKQEIEFTGFLTKRTLLSAVSKVWAFLPKQECS